MILSPHFTLEEMTVSQEAARRGMPNYPSDFQLAYLRRLCNEILEPLRKHLGVPIVVTSGLRTKAVNALVGGAENSSHIYGRAADILVPGFTPREVCQAAINLNLPFHQVIQEFGQWTHISIPENGAPIRREVLTARNENGKTIYVKGLT